MRRKDREVTDAEELLEIIKANKVCRLGMADGNQPYVVPLNYGFEFDSGRLVLYFHGAGEGKKIGILKKNSQVCFEIDGEHGLAAGKNACDYGFSFASIIGFGNACFIDSEAEKARALALLMKHQTGEGRDFEFAPAQLRAVTVFKVTALSLTGKRRTPPPGPHAGQVRG
ncbi:MAG: pyridoxamine 5'-phosphate oxidase family protein [Spirochaetaceae bacterium]|jgi:nitroimidazol reductase NimA-like FMN-containing flavoprotein (pyridoxamine 5'-phosphate oxidase superfamily)|nr:pyridoxamine 5'-phosphate oxidase family protein [Spirochaetaceae bacterium]